MKDYGQVPCIFGLLRPCESHMHGFWTLRGCKRSSDNSFICRFLPLIALGDTDVGLGPSSAKRPRATACGMVAGTSADGSPHAQRRVARALTRPISRTQRSCWKNWEGSLLTRCVMQNAQHRRTSYIACASLPALPATFSPLLYLLSATPMTPLICRYINSF